MFSPISIDPSLSKTFVPVRSDQGCASFRGGPEAQQGRVWLELVWRHQDVLLVPPPCGRAPLCPVLLCGRRQALCRTLGDEDVRGGDGAITAIEMFQIT